jgi:uncharacterized membrane protein
VEISVNGKQIIAVIWSLVAIVIALIVVLAMGNATFADFGGFFAAPWEWLIVLFFGLVLIITIPVYLLLALWSVVSRSDSS